MERRVLSRRIASFLGTLLFHRLIRVLFNRREFNVREGLTVIRNRLRVSPYASNVSLHRFFRRGLIPAIIVNVRVNLNGMMIAIISSNVVVTQIIVPILVNCIGVNRTGRVNHYLKAIRNCRITARLTRRINAITSDLRFVSSASR